MKSLSFRGLPEHAVTKDGRIFSHLSNRFLSPCMRGEYLSIGLYLKGKRVGVSVHRLVAEAFIPNPEGKPCVNHIDGNKLNNHVSNLEWVTHSENAIHAVDTGLKGPTVNAYRQLTRDTICRICTMLQDGFRVKDVSEALGVRQPVVSMIKAGKQYKDISSEFDLTTIPYKGRVSVDKVTTICEMLSKAEPMARIIRQTGCSTKTVKDIKKRLRYTAISQNYHW